MRRAVLVILAALAIAGCGSSTSAHDAFVAKANAICAKTQERTEHVSDARVARRLPIHGPEAVGKVATLLATSADELAAVKPSASVGAVYERFVVGYLREANLLKQLAVHYRAKDRAGLERVERERQAVHRDREAKALGLTKCG